MTYFPFKVCKTHSKLSEISPESAFSILFPILLEQEKAVHLYSDIFHKRSPQLELQCFILMPPFPIFKVVQKSSLSPPFQLIMSATSCSIILNTSQYLVTWKILIYPSVLFPACWHMSSIKKQNIQEGSPIFSVIGIHACWFNWIIVSVIGS